MVDALAVLISFPYVLCTPSMVQKIFNGVYFSVVALSALISFPYVLYTLSENEKILNGVISCGRCFSRSLKFSIGVIYTLYGTKDIQWSI